ncbi:MAG: MFS transporter [Corynebacterium casei]|nr:MFS transporter [Corynebacterium casei]MDN6154560.1 MFS transporter [Corynebacterium casei]
MTAGHNARLRNARKEFDNNSTPVQRWSFFAAISLGLLMIGLDNSILFTALPTLTEELHADDTQQLWIINAYPLVLAGLLLGTGTLGDKIGHRRMFTTGLVIFGVASLAAAFSPTPAFLIAARALLGLGAAVMMPATLALIRLTFTNEQERNTAIGIWGSVAVVGAAAGPVVGGALLEVWWWGSVFLINVPIVVIALIATALLAPPNMANPIKHWDLVSSIFALVTLTGLTLTIKELANPNRSWILIAVAFVAFIIGGHLFVQRQNKLDEPLLTFDVFRNRLFAGGVIAASGAMFIMAGLEMITAQKLQLADDFSPFHAGLVVAAAAVAALPMSALGGANLHRIGFLPLISGGFLLATIGTGLAMWSTHADSVPLLITGLLFLGAGAGSIMSVSSIAIIGSVPMHRSGMAAGVEEVSYEFGTLLSVAFVGSLTPALYLTNLPAELKHMGIVALHGGLGHAQASTAYASAYGTTVGFMAVFAFILTIVTVWCFRDNPKSGGNGGAH